MKKILIIAFSMIMVFTLAGCKNATNSKENNTKETVTITTLNGNKEVVNIEVPYNPKRIAVMDLAALDILDKFGLTDRIVGVSKGSNIEYLKKYVEDDSLINLGTIVEASLEKVMESDPDIIFIGGRLAKVYDDLSKIAPVVYLSKDVEIGLVESTKNNAMTVASIFGEEDKVESLFNGFHTRIASLQEVAKGKTAFVGMLSTGSFNVLGNDARGSLIGVEVGFENIGIDTKSSEGSITSTHGNETSFEYILRLNPDYIFVLDRDKAIGTEGVAPAVEVIENELVKKTDAYKNGHIIYLEQSNIWYTAEGGITALDLMIKDLEKALLDK